MPSFRVGPLFATPSEPFLSGFQRGETFVAPGTRRAPHVGLLPDPTVLDRAAPRRHATLRWCVERRVFVPSARVADSTKFEERKGGRQPDEEATEAPAITDARPRGMWELFNGQPPAAREPAKPRGAWNWLNQEVDARNLGQEGLHGAGAALPHADAIQKSFGRHDVSGIGAHSGGAAEKATDSLGAKAYAQGDRVAFDSASPSLHTAAHEAAHVVQHRRGSVPTTAVDGGPATAHEQHANAVADRVVRGESAEALLDQVGADRASAPAPVVQRTPKTEQPKKKDSAKAAKNSGPRDLEDAVKVGHQSLELLATAKTLLPAYRRAVNALDPMAAMELARVLIGTLNQAEEGKREIGETLGNDPPQHWMVSRPGEPETTETVVVDKWNQASGLCLQLSGSLMMFEMELATQLGPQQLDGSAVMGKVELPKLAEDALPYLISEAGVVVELLGVVNEAMRLSGAKIGTCPQISQTTAQQIVKLVTPWKSRPVNFGFLVAALRKIGLWDEINSTKSAEGKTLEQTNRAVAAQAKETGALADVGELDLETTDQLLGKRDQLIGDVHYTNRVTDGKAQIVLDKLIGAAADARGPLIKQMQKMGRLGEVCQHLPWKTVAAIHDAVEPFDKEAANLLVPFYAGKGGGESMHQIYEGKIMGDIEQKKYVRAYLWTFLEEAHNALTAGFEREVSEAQEAHNAGLITDDAFHSAAGKALGKAAAITIASAATGGVAGEFGEGLAAGLGASKSAASIIGAGVGGFGAGIGGHLAGDTFDQAFNGKKGFDSFAAYMRSGAQGGIMGTVLGGVSVGAGKYLGENGAATRPIDQMAQRYPRNASVLERFRSAGFSSGTKIKGAASGAVTKIRVTAAELADMIADGLAIPGPKLATINGAPPRTEFEISLKPMQMSGDESTKIGAGETKATPAQPPKLEIEEAVPVKANSEPEKSVSDSGGASKDASSESSANEAETSSAEPVTTSKTPAEPKTATTPSTKTHVHEGEIERDPQSPYFGKWNGKGLHDWEGVKAACDRDGFKILKVKEDPVTGIRRVEIERSGVFPKTKAPIKGVMEKTIYPKSVKPAEMDAAAESALEAATSKQPETDFKPYGEKLKRDKTPVDGYFKAKVKVGDPPREMTIEGWFKQAPDGTKTITSHAPRYSESWPELDPKDY